MSRPRLLDLFCGSGGAGMGYHRAGFDVVGVDLNPQPRYPFEFHQADAITFPLEGFDAIHASPPCQAHTATNALTRSRNTTRVRPAPAQLIAPMRERLAASGIPWVIENVVGAPLIDPILLCGSMFDLGVRRHRLFESSLPLHVWPVRCNHKQQGKVIGVWGDHPDPPRPYRTNCAVNLATARTAMGMGWTTWRELCQAIPPAYTKFIGEQIINMLRGVPSV